MNDLEKSFDGSIRKQEIQEANKNQPHIVWFHSTGKIIGFTASNGQEIPALICGDNYLMPIQDARVLEDAGAGYVRKEPPSNVPRWMTGAQLGRK